MMPPAQPSTASIAGTVFTDTTGDHILNWGDTGIGGVEVDLLNASGQMVATTYTAADGTYHFNGLSAGTYSVQMVPPAGTKVMYPDVGSVGGNANSTDTGITSISVSAGRPPGATT
jgi:serine-aspartate repeat-containing protein C/D/E